MPFDEKLIDGNEQITENNENILAPTQATLERINVGLNHNVSIGDPILVLTAMKMEVSKLNYTVSGINIKVFKKFQYIVKAQINGKIEKILRKERDSVRKGELLVKIKPNE